MQVASLTSAAERVMANIVQTVSPSKNACRVRVKCCAPSVFYCYRNDPYSARLFSSPVKAAMTAAMASPLAARARTPTSSVDLSPNTVPMENRLMHQPSLLAAAAVEPQPAAAQPELVHSAAPKAKAAASPLEHFAFVKFKHDSTTYLAPFKVVAGEYVIVEGDRGEHIGVIEDITTVRPTYPVPCRILRRASRKERDILFGAKKTKEANTTKSTQQLADSIGLSIKIVDTEFQLDNNKLTVFFVTKQNHIDFRKLQRGLFREFRCRIWLTNVAELEAQQKMPRMR